MNDGMPYSGSPEEQKEKQRLYNLKNKEKTKDWRIKNKDKVKQKQKEYREKNKDRIKEYNKQYHQTPAGKKFARISNWRKSGVMCDDWDALYQKYLTTHLCQLCSCPLTEDSISTSTTRCLDHCHDTGLFRNVLCWNCNINVVR